VVGVAQVVEHRVVAPVVVGSSPITHPILNEKTIDDLTWSSMVLLLDENFLRFSKSAKFKAPEFGLTG
jgi:hypothetical protein